MVSQVETAKLVIERLLYLKQLRDVALAAFKAGKPSDRLPSSTVSAHVARVLDIEDSPMLRSDLHLALRAAGWRSVIRARARRWKGMRPR